MGGDAGNGLARARMQVVAQHRLGTLHQAAFALEKIRIQRLVAVDGVLQQGGGGAWLTHLLFHPLPPHDADRVAAQAVVVGGAAGSQCIAAARVDEPLHLVLQRWRQAEIVRVAHGLRKIHRGAELQGLAEAHRHHFPIDDRRGGGIAGTEVDAEFHADRPESGPRTLLRLPHLPSRPAASVTPWPNAKGLCCALAPPQPRGRAPGQAASSAT